jgi:predicted DNA-binding antitoxin AbrB/MazE fold protein
MGLPLFPTPRLCALSFRFTNLAAFLEDLLHESVFGEAKATRNPACARHGGPICDRMALRRTGPMTKNLQAVCENGVLRPLEPLDLREQQLVNVTLSDEAPPEPWLDAERLAACAGEADDAVSLGEVRAALAKIPGSLTEDFIAEREER